MVKTVTAAAALEWAGGVFDDAALFAQPGTACAVIAELPDRRSYFSVIRSLRAAADAGALFLITRTGNPVVSRHLEELGAIATATESSISCGQKRRYVLPPEQWRAWLKKVGKDAKPQNKPAVIQS